ncbi:MAG: hypothetical protein ACOX6S_13940 [Clostridia bacterium]
MIYLVTAHLNEARPLIRRLGLKKVQTAEAFAIYEGEDTALIISGIGKIRSAAAVSHLLSLKPPARDSLFVNIGICGAKNREIAIGQSILIHKLLDHDTGRAFYPDILWKHPFPEDTLETFSHAVHNDQIQQVRGKLVDMEGTGFFEAASLFLGPHQIQLIKIVSDHLEGKPLNREIIEGLMERAADPICSHIQSIHGSFRPFRDVLEADELELLESIGCNLRLTATQRSDLLKNARLYKLRNKKSLEWLVDYQDIHVQSKQERKKALESLYAQLDL